MNEPEQITKSAILKFILWTVVTIILLGVASEGGTTGFIAALFVAGIVISGIYKFYRAAR